jgi:hypothetical protein
MNKKAFILGVLGVAVLGWIGGGGASAQSIPPQCVELMNAKPEGTTSEAITAQLEWFKEVRKCIEENRDVLAPSLIIEAPGEVDAGKKDYTITGYVGDSGSVPTVTVNGEAVELVAPGEGAPDLGTHTLSFTLTISVSLEKGQHIYIFEALDANGNSIAEETVVSLVAANSPKFRGDYYALIIGNGEYDFMPPVETAVSDAKAVARVLTTYYLFEKENVKVAINATRRDILSALSQLKRDLGRYDRLFVYYSGHSYIDDITGTGFWQAVDADEFDDFSWVSIDSVTRNLAGMQAKHVIVIADSAFPVAVDRGTAYAQTTEGGTPCSADDRYFEEIDSWATRKLIVSGVLTPEANKDSGDNSVFAQQLVRVLEENRDCYITSKQLYDRLSRNVSGMSDQKPEWGTVANAGDEGSGEFTFILRAKPQFAED